MKRIILKESQLKSVINYRSDEILKEEILEEEFKEWALAGLIALASMTDIKAQTQPIDSSHIKAAELIQNKLESGDEDLYQLFSDAQIELNRENLEKLKSVSKKDFENAKIETYKTKSDHSIISKQRQGFTVSDIKVTKDTLLPKNSIIVLEDSIELDTDNIFETGGYELSEYAKSKINDIFNVLSEEGEITKVVIESSTDKEPISMGNEELAKLRAESVVNIVDSFDVDDVDVITKPNQGPNIYGPNMSRNEKSEAREQTKEYRYVKISVLLEVTAETKMEAGSMLYNYEVEMVKLKQTFKPKKYNKYRKSIFTKKTHKKPKCKKVKVKGKELPCFFEPSL